MDNPYGFLKIFRHNAKLQSLLEERVTAPIYSRIKPTNTCNHHCFFCSFNPDHEYILSETIKRDDKIPREKMMEILSDFKDMGVKAIAYSGGGEPLTYPYIEETMKKTLEYDINLAIITNGQKLNGERAELLTQAKWVRISLDATNAEIFSETRKVPEKFFYELVENIENFAQKKNPKCELGINFIVHNKNSDQIYNSVRFLRDLGVNHVKITPMWLEQGFFEYHSQTKDKVLEQISKAREEISSNSFRIYDTYENDFNMSGVCERIYSRCYIMQIVPVIAADSKVYFCHDKAYTTSGVLGSIKNQSFKDLWFSEQVAEKFQNFDPQENCKHYCTNDFKNRLINEVITNPRKLDELLEKNSEIDYGQHINFI